MSRLLLPFYLTVGLVLGSVGTVAAKPLPYVAHVELADTVLEISEVAGGLDGPWELAWGPDDFLWLTQLRGVISRIDPTTGAKTDIGAIPDVFHRKSHGLLSMTFSPDWAESPYVYLHYVYQVPRDDRREEVRSRVVRCRWDGARLGAPEVVFDHIPGQTYHNGSRMAFGPDGKLYLTTGDSGRGGTQDPTKLNGKVLRLNPDGSVPADNPIPDNPTWSMGHRNAQGLVFAPDGQLYASEHGPNNDDELNRIVALHNYGWPDVAGFIDGDDEKAYAANHDITEPLVAWTPTIGAAGLDYYAADAIPEWRGSLLLVALKGQALRVLELDATGGAIAMERIYFQKIFGRLRDLCLSPGGDVYVITSNTDWHPRFQPWMYEGLPAGPDRILRLRRADAASLARIAALGSAAMPLREDPEPLPLMSEDWSFPATSEDLLVGQGLYAIHCAACHSPTGEGAGDLLPPLVGTAWVTGDKGRLIRAVMGGLSGEIEVNGVTYNQEMPAFKHLPDDELAAVLTFIRQSWGNDANAVIPGEVYEERKGLR
ncbi:PQQ-dependent sugar dehydrogenase [Synoicihabitans lomoniglobus]|uniref:PQQ-dependent sugar dehydrogenase n=1 Tax=Synoicihabitans lomoniglobus TaxID=2909285 RepID=A0AAF0CPG7_9BACT|nr:PQQ-dependent sugar dehydrogenase [Opitutaceae bacterium LMO-M01]WED64654.1 PQQ-dependent sugar dehydrogenase [Opitutaceae bacterium LMO-M01]